MAEPSQKTIDRRALMSSLVQKASNDQAESVSKVIETQMSQDLTPIPLDLLDPNPFQPRTFFPETMISELAESIRSVGLLQPIVVRQVGSRYQIALGECRFRATKSLGETKILAHVKSLTDDQMSLIALIENQQRNNLTDYEAAHGYIKHITRFYSETDSIRSLALKLDISHVELGRYLSFKDMPQSMANVLAKNPSFIGRRYAYSIRTHIQTVTVQVKSIADQELIDQIDLAMKNALAEFATLLEDDQSQSKFFEIFKSHTQMIGGDANKQTQTNQNSQTEKQKPEPKIVKSATGHDIGKLLVTPKRLQFDFSSARKDLPDEFEQELAATLAVFMEKYN